MVPGNGNGAQQNESTPLEYAVKNNYLGDGLAENIVVKFQVK